jgi:DNA-binding MarR family transcriptional regulator
VAIEGVPTPLPMTSAIARAIVPNGYMSTEGLTIETNAWIGDGYLELRVPEAWEALTLWAQDAGASVELSPPGRIAQALLARLDSLHDLAALADEAAVRILAALAPTSRKKLAQRVVREALDRGDNKLDEEVLAGLLRREALFLELQARSAAEIAGEAQMKKRDLLPALAKLVEAGFITRGASVRCPLCGFGDVVALAEQDETIACRACRHEFLLPVLDPGEDAESAVVYRLDGLMARAVDQDLTPALLALHALGPAPGQRPLRAAWLGLDFRGGAWPGERDALISDGAEVWVGECQLRAAGLPSEQLKGLLGFAAARCARPFLAALEGEFTDTQRAAVTAARGRVFERGELIK